MKNNITSCTVDAATPLPDTLTHAYIPLKKVVAQSGCSGSKNILQCRILRNFVGSAFPSCTITENGWIILDFGQEISGGVRLVTGLMENALIRLRFGESIAESCGDPDMDHAVHDIQLNLSLLSSTDFGNTGFRFVRLDVLSGTLNLVNVIAIADDCGLTPIGKFESSDSLLNRIFEVSSKTVHLCIQDYILDGIKRDRLLWGGDMHPATAAILNLYGNIPQLDKTLEQLCFNTPPDAFVNNHTSYPLWLLLTLYDYYLYCGDPEILEKYRPFIIRNVESYLSMISADGTVNLPGHVFLDWPSHQDNNGIQSGVRGLLASALKSVLQMYKAMRIADQPIRDALQYLQINVPDVGANKSAAALQHLAGLADRSKIIETDPFSGISTFMSYYILQCKKPASALELIKRYWGGMLDMGATSFWEDFDLAWLQENPTRIDEMPNPGRLNIHADFGRYCYKGLRHSLCHAWSAGPVPWIMQTILGVKPLEPGFKHISFMPELCNLEWAEGSLPTPYGTITVKISSKHSPEISLPENVLITKKA